MTSWATVGIYSVDLVVSVARRTRRDRDVVGVRDPRPRVLAAFARVALAGALATSVLVGLFSSSAAGSKLASSRHWSDEPVTFHAGGVTIYATFRHPLGDATPVPAALLIAGSGPTDRNGNSSLEPGKVNTLKTIADWLSADGVASLRYDKLASGATGLGPYASKIATIGVLPFEQEAAGALEFLARQKGIDDQRLGVIGHSEGALYALLLATGHSGTTPKIHALGLIEPLSVRYLDLISLQVKAQVAAEAKAGQITAKLEKTVDATLTRAVARLRATGKVASNLAYGLGTILNPSNATYLYEADKFDPTALAAALDARTPVLVTCSNADLQVTCAETDQIVKGLAKAGASTDYVHLKGVDHVLKVDASGAATNYTKSLPFSPMLRSDLQRFVARNL